MKPAPLMCVGKDLSPRLNEAKVGGRRPTKPRCQCSDLIFIDLERLKATPPALSAVEPTRLPQSTIRSEEIEQFRE
jgi:hypothetical protein